MINEFYENFLSQRDDILNDPVKLAEADAEIERRRKINLETSSQWGLISKE